MGRALVTISHEFRSLRDFLRVIWEMRSYLGTSWEPMGNRIYRISIEHNTVAS
jgi:hypothetical protein